MRNQRQMIKNLFESKPNEWVPCYEISRIALQYNARIKELRESGMSIENKFKMVDGIKHSWFRYVPSVFKVEEVGNNAQIIFA